MTEEQRRFTPADFIDEGQELPSPNKYWTIGDAMGVNIEKAVVVDVSGQGVTVSWRENGKVLEAWLSPGVLVHRLQQRHSSLIAP